jgi:hypothetical protein
MPSSSCILHFQNACICFLGYRGPCQLVKTRLPCTQRCLHAQRYGPRTAAIGTKKITSARCAFDRCIRLQSHVCKRAAPGLTAMQLWLCDAFALPICSSCMHGLLARCPGCAVRYAPRCPRPHAFAPPTTDIETQPAAHVHHVDSEGLHTIRVCGQSDLHDNPNWCICMLFMMHVMVIT